MKSQSMVLVRGLLSYSCLAAIITALDIWAGAEISLWVFYYLPIGLAAWNLGRPAAILMLAICIVLLLGTTLTFGHTFSSPIALGIALLSRVLAWSLVVWLILLYRSREIERAFVPPGAKKTKR